MTLGVLARVVGVMLIAYAPSRQTNALLSTTDSFVLLLTKCPNAFGGATIEIRNDFVIRQSLLEGCCLA